jgi:hypothetical protein
VLEKDKTSHQTNYSISNLFTVQHNCVETEQYDFVPKKEGKTEKLEKQEKKELCFYVKTFYD